MGDVEADESIEETLRCVRTRRKLMRGFLLEVVEDEDEVVEGREELDPVGEGGREEAESLRSEEEVELDEEEEELILDEGQKGVAL